MRFSIEPQVFETLSGMRIAVVVADGIDNAASRPAVSRAWREAWGGAEAMSVYGNAQSHPHIVPWRDAWSKMGVSARKFPTSIEALLKRAMKGGEPFSINPVVDFYNAVSLGRVLPAGAFDTADLGDALELRFTREGDTFQALDDAAPVKVPAGEIAYATGRIIVTRHIVWRQSRAGLIKPETTRLILMSEVLAGLADELVESVASDFRNGLRTFFGVDSKSFVVDERTPSVSW